jgi:hypothetical protein
MRSSAGGIENQLSVQDAISALCALSFSGTTRTIIQVTGCGVRTAYGLTTVQGEFLGGGTMWPVSTQPFLAPNRNGSKTIGLSFPMIAAPIDGAPKTDAGRFAVSRSLRLRALQPHPAAGSQPVQHTQMGLWWPPTGRGSGSGGAAESWPGPSRGTRVQASNRPRSSAEERSRPRRSDSPRTAGTLSAAWY